MKEATLLRIALAIALIGIATLFALSQKISVDEAMLGRLDGMIDETVLVSGVILDISSTEGVTFLRIQKEEMTSVVLFGNAPVVEVGDYVQVLGTVTEQDGESEIIGEEVRVI